MRGGGASGAAVMEIISGSLKNPRYFILIHVVLKNFVRNTLKLCTQLRFGLPFLQTVSEIFNEERCNILSDTIVGVFVFLDFLSKKRNKEIPLKLEIDN